MRVLLVAPTTDPTDVGEAWVAAQWAERLGHRHDVTLLTYRKRSRPSAVAALPHVRVVEWVEPPLLGRAERLNSLMKPAYLPFHARARRWIRDATARGERFDVAHQPLPVAMRYPTPLCGQGIPYVLGPVGGSLVAPPAFDAEDTAPWWTGLRRVDGWRMRHDRALRAGYAGAACVLGIAPYVAEALAPVPLRRFEVLSETALRVLPPATPRPAPQPGEPLRLLFVGRLVRTKGARDAIAALAHLRDVPVVLDVVGDGFDRAACERLAVDLGVADRVRFHGTQPREQVDRFYAQADVFVFPSYREPGGNVAYEAMGHGLPAVVVDRGGPGEAVTDACGIRVAAHTPAQLARDLAAAVRRLADDPPARTAMGRAARERVATTGLWDHKIDWVSGLYEQLAREEAARVRP
ncbi:glycosyltransferase family 4 protein [Nocardioides sp. 1609]|uniref:glycosyltransferase family 4 protein n=1 Tax=Nocardioides sp. 1609 TaxID=2508327 RepID=UPI00106F5158|nr:glycosyltransferase family 4 protein [Nocardioides sp. 1609]